MTNLYKTNSYHYINITEGDDTPVTNGEQFDITVKITNPQGIQTTTTPTYEKQQWLVRLLLANKGTYTIEVEVKCEERKGHCFRLYPEGSAKKEHTFELK